MEAYLEMVSEKKAKLDPVDDKANDKKFADRKDKDIDNDGEVDSSDEFLHKRRKAIDNEKDGGEKPADNAKPKKGVNPFKEVKEGSLTEALSPQDKKVVDAFYDGKDMTGKTVKSVGDKLETMGMGGQVILKREKNKFKVVASVDGSGVQSLLKYIKKSYPKNTLIEQTDVEEGKMLSVTNEAKDETESEKDDKKPFPPKKKGEVEDGETESEKDDDEEAPVDTDGESDTEEKPKKKKGNPKTDDKTAEISKIGETKEAFIAMWSKIEEAAAPAEKLDDKESKKGKEFIDTHKVEVINKDQDLEKVEKPKDVKLKKEMNEWEVIRAVLSGNPTGGQE